MNQKIQFKNIQLFKAKLYLNEGTVVYNISILEMGNIV